MRLELLALPSFLPCMEMVPDPPEVVRCKFSLDMRRLCDEVGM